MHYILDKPRISSFFFFFFLLQYVGDCCQYVLYIYIYILKKKANRCSAHSAESQSRCRSTDTARSPPIFPAIRFSTRFLFQVCAFEFERVFGTLQDLFHDLPSVVVAFRHFRRVSGVTSEPPEQLSPYPLFSWVLSFSPCL